MPFMPERSSIRPPSQTAVPATLCPPAHREQQVVRAGKFNAPDHVRGTRAADEQGGAPVDHPVEDPAGHVVATVSRAKQLPAQAGSELLEGPIVDDLACSAHDSPVYYSRRNLGSSKSRMPSPTRLRPRTASMRAAPGASIVQGAEAR
jgi:hypothetical protein